MTMRITANEAAKIFITNRLEGLCDSLSYDEYRGSICGLEDATDKQVERFHKHLKKHAESIVKRLKGRELWSKYLNLEETYENDDGCSCLDGYICQNCRYENECK